MSDVSASRAPALHQDHPATPAAHAVPATHAAPAAHAVTVDHADAATAGVSGPTALLILGTGGTIAGAAASAGSATGYQAGALPIGEILASVPGLAALVPDRQLASEQVFSIPSEQMDSAHWLQLLARVRAWQSASRAADAIVITHGTDTLEETAFFLSLVLPPDRPVILTGAMRPATALSADGPANLYDACRFALAARAAGIGGAFVQFAGKILRPDAVFKAHANQTDAFGQRFGAPVGWLEGDVPRWAAPEVLAAATGWQGLFAGLDLGMFTSPGVAPFSGPDQPAVQGQSASQGQLPRQEQPTGQERHTDQGQFTVQKPFTAQEPFASQGQPADQTGTLPRIALVPQYVDADPALVDWLVQRGHAGLVLAGTGIGTMPAPVRAALAAARQQGVMVVRATRVPAGYVPRNTEARPEHSDDALGFVTAGWLDAPKARILLQLCLAAGLRDEQAIQAVFERFRP
ncbi:MAG: asparaginase [Lautropia sp.]|nr:MAG: asparaginase [Lautropia sp.]